MQPSEILDAAEIDTELVKSILESHVKPQFLTNPHPQLNLSTGRALHRIAGGAMASQDYYDEQNWKNRPGLAGVISWCIRSVPVSIALLNGPINMFLIWY